MAGIVWKLMHATESFLLIKFRRKVSVNFMRASKSKGYDTIATEPPSKFFITLSQWFSNFLRCDAFKKACETLRRTRQHPTV